MIDMKEYGLIETPAPADGLIPARITEQQRELYTVVCPQGEVLATLSGAFRHRAEAGEYPCVGDFGWLEYNASGHSRIAALMSRRSAFARADFSGHVVGYAKTIQQQVVAANFDTVFIVSSLNKDFNVNRILRYLTQAWQSGGVPVVVLTKADLADEAERCAAVAAVEEAAPGVEVYAVSAHTGEGLDALAPHLQPGKTVVFLGMSGVGKSSLLNALMQENVMHVSAIREDDARGRHTTTHRALFMLPSGAMVIDTPGMRELGLIDAEEGVSAGFADVEELFMQCRFTDCRHETEPGCAVLSAMENGSLSAERWERYRAQVKEIKFTEDKAAYVQNKKAFQKSIARYTRANNKKR